jgi:mannose-6-phosphate isomerase
MTTRFGSATQGLSVLGDGRLLRDAVEAEPLAWLGAAHVEAYGAETDLLVKLLDVGQRLVVHVHPDRAFAQRHLGCRHGKSEAWIVLETAGDASVVYLGFRREVAEDELRRWVDTQDTTAMLDALNVVPVAPGDAIFVPAGVPHAIGEGMLLVELQEPTDFSILMEWKGFDIDGVVDGHLDLGFDLALSCVDRSPRSSAEVDALRGPVVDSARARLLPTAADPYFRAERLRDGAELPAGFAVVVTIAGSGSLSTEHGGALPLTRGDTVAIPHAAGAARVDGDVELICCLPPDPTAPGGP